MGLLGSAPVEAQVVPAGGFQPFMPQDLFDVAYGAAIEQESVLSGESCANGR